MNCNAAGKYLHAFADGQLGVEVNCQVLDHLKLCDRCGRIVVEHQALRQTLGEHLAAVEIPPGLEDRVRRSLALGKVVDRRRGLRRYLTIRGMLAAAACIALATMLIRQQAFFGDVVNHPVIVAAAGDAAFRVVERHNLCCRRHAAHHHPELPHRLTGLATAIADHHHDSLRPLTPDLSRLGFEFESANFCGLGDAGDDVGGDCGRGAHLLYVMAKPAGEVRISVFSIPRRDDLDAGLEAGLDAGLEARLETAAARDGYSRFTVKRNGEPAVAVAVWHQDATSYVCCGEVDGETIAAIAANVRTALQRPGGSEIFAMW